MKKLIPVYTVALGILMLFATSDASAFGRKRVYQDYDRGARWFNANVPWHMPYYHVPYGRPTAVIVPPTAGMQTNYSWGVGRTRMTPIYHQFGRNIATPTGGIGTTQPKPRWPSDTNQFGLYYVRGPW